MSKAWHDISPQEVEKRLAHQKEDMILIDVRNPDEYSAGHIAQAQLLPLPILPIRLHEIRKDKQVVFICRSGGRSAQACEYAAQHGYEQIFNMTGGMLNWQGEIAHK
ncbi:UNVERIFIED_CONTAM: rhodanese-related sulfurtransferase [Brevibacillus sp. OAP136]